MASAAAEQPAPSGPSAEQTDASEPPEAGRCSDPPLATVHRADAALRLDPSAGRADCAVDLQVQRPDGSSGLASLHADRASLHLASLAILTSNGQPSPLDHNHHWWWRTSFLPPDQKICSSSSSSRDLAKACRDETERRISCLEMGELVVLLPSEVTTLRVVYSAIPAAASGGGASAGIMHTVPAPCGLSAWMPCNGEPRSRSTYRIVLDVPHGCTAIASGWKEESEDDAHLHVDDMNVNVSDAGTSAHVRKPKSPSSCASCNEHMHGRSGTSGNAMKLQELERECECCSHRVRCAFRVDSPCPSEQIVIAAGHFHCAPDDAVDCTFHLAPLGYERALRLASQTIELPLLVITETVHMQRSSLIGNRYTQVFLPVESGYGIRHAGQNVSFIGCEALSEPQQSETAMELRLLCARMLTKQVYGIALMPATPGDTWMLEGISKLFERKVMMKIFGENEALYRRQQEALALKDADDGSLPALGTNRSEAPAGWWRCNWEGCGPETEDLMLCKSEIVMSILERKAGPDAMSRILRRLARLGAKRATIHTEYLLEQLAGKHGGIEEGDVRSFAERYIFGSGCPTFHVAAVYQKRKHVLELGLREDGSRASKKASMIARNVARAAAWGASINVRVQEQDGAHDHRVSLGANPFAFSELQLHSRREQPKKSISKKQQGGSGKQNQKDKQPQQQSQSHPEQKDENEQETIESPVDWITLDPEKEWLLHDVTYQPQRCWEAILERDKDATRQLEAVEQLQERVRTSASLPAVDALAATLRRRTAFCRIRAAAACALGRSTSQRTQWKGQKKLVSYFRSNRMDTCSGFVLPPRLHDFGEHIVDCAVLEGLALVRDKDGQTPQECVDIVHDALERCIPPESMTEGDDSASIAHLLSILPLLRPSAEDSVEGIVESIVRFLRRERGVASPECTVGCAAMDALVNLYTSARSLFGLSSKFLLDEIESAMLWAPPPLRRAGYAAVLEVLITSGFPLERCVSQTALSAIGRESSRQVQEYALWDCADVVAHHLGGINKQCSEKQKAPDALAELACGRGRALRSTINLQIAFNAIVHAFSGFAAATPLGTWGRAEREGAIDLQEPPVANAKLSVPLQKLPMLQDQQEGENAHEHAGMVTPRNVGQNGWIPQPMQVDNSGQEQSNPDAVVSKSVKDLWSQGGYGTPQHAANGEQNDAAEAGANGHAHSKKRKRRQSNLPGPDELGGKLGSVHPELEYAVPRGASMDKAKGAIFAFERMSEEGTLPEALQKAFDITLRDEPVDSEKFQNIEHSKMEKRKVIIRIFGIPPELLDREGGDEVFQRSVKDAAKAYISQRRDQKQHGQMSHDYHHHQQQQQQQSQQSVQASKTNNRPSEQRRPDEGQQSVKDPAQHPPVAKAQMASTAASNKQQQKRPSLKLRLGKQ